MRAFVRPLRHALGVALLAAPLHAQTAVISITPPIPYGEFVSFGGPVGYASMYAGQTFTAPTGVDQLDSFRFFLTDTYNGTGLIVGAKLYALDAFGIPTGAPLFSSAGRPGATGSGWQSFLFNVGVPVIAGARYVALLTGTVDVNDPIGIAVNTVATSDGGAKPDLYSGGDFVWGDDPSSLTAEGYDAAFDASFTKTVPEPASSLLVAAGLLSLAVAHRRRTRA